MGKIKAVARRETKNCRRYHWSQKSCGYNTYFVKLLDYCWTDNHERRN